VAERKFKEIRQRSEDHGNIRDGWVHELSGHPWSYHGCWNTSRHGRARRTGLGHILLEDRATFSPFQRLQIVRSGGGQTVDSVAFAFGFLWQLKFQMLV